MLIQNFLFYHILGEVKVSIQNFCFIMYWVRLRLVLIQNFLFHRLRGEVNVIIQNFLFHYLISHLVLKLAA